MRDPEQQDIDLLIREIEHIKINLNDPSLGSVFWEETMKDLIKKHGSKLIELMNELVKRRGIENKINH